MSKKDIKILMEIGVLELFLQIWLDFVKGNRSRIGSEIGTYEELKVKN